MRILFLTPHLPYPPSKGTALRNLYILRGASRNHTVHLLTFARDSDQDAIETLRRDLEAVEVATPPTRSTIRRLAGLPSPLPDLVSRLRSGEFRAKLEKTIETGGFDLVQVEGLEMGPYALEVCLLRRADARRPLVLFDDHNAEYALQRSAYRADLGLPGRWPKAAYSLLQWRKLRSYERKVCLRADGVMAVSEADASSLRALAPGLRPRVIPNGVDTTAFGYRSLAGRSDGGAPVMVFTGTMDYRPNVDAAVWFCHQVLPLVRREQPSAKLLLVGRDPSQAVKSLAGHGVSVTGSVEDVRPYLHQGNVFVAPLRMGSGTRLKILEAMSAGLPVVSTTIGLEGIAATPGEEALVADDPKSFASRVLELLADPARAGSLATRARLLVERRYDWEVILPALGEVYREMSERIGS
ncbi:MAG: glycosyltransferase [Dehalococcoidia bacterium]|nr:glycosyltransferase [Dehalococcoidia bacterium]